MKLWKIERTDDSSSGDFDSAIVAAKTALAARKITPDGRPFAYYSNWAPSVSDVRATYLGEARPGTTAGVILARVNPD